MEALKVFSRETGRAENYRIPSIVVTNRGTVVAAADERFYTGADNPNRIDKVIRRSTDSGRTWESQTVAVEEVGTAKNNASAAIDPQLIYDREADKILMIYCHTPAQTFILNSRRSVGEDANGRRIIRRGKEVYYLDADGALIDEKGNQTEYRADRKGNVTLNGKYVCNYLTYDGAFREDDTSYLMLTESTDDGKSWSEPVSLNRQIKSKKWGFIGPGPGIGIQLQYGKHKGRLVSPIYYNATKWPLMLNAFCIYSDDHGKTWKKSSVPNDLKKSLLCNSKFILSYSGCTTESQIVEKKDGSLWYVLRNHDKRREAMAADSVDGAETFQNLRFVPDITHPICQIAAISADFNGREAILVSHAKDKTKRKFGVIQMSLDGGNTFPYEHVVTEGEFVYSSMAMLPDGRLGILYEPSTEHETIDFKSYDLNEIFKGAK